MLAADLRAFLSFVQERDPVIVALRSSESPEISQVAEPSLETQVMTLWNQDILGSLERKIVNTAGRVYYSVDLSELTLEFSPSRQCKWNGRDALLPGRIYGLFETTSPKLEKWYRSLRRWIQKNFIKSSLPLIGYLGPAAFEWYKKGGLLLPNMVPPPVTPVWVSWVEAQDQHRAVFPR